MKLIRAASVVAFVAWASASEAQTPLRATQYAAGFTGPVAFVQDPTDRTVQLVVEQGGRIRAVKNGVVLSPDFLNLTAAIASDGERGLLGLAFSPDYALTGRLFVNFTDTAGNTIIARFRRSTPLLADASSRFDFRWPSGQRFIAQPYANHNGGHLAFGPDGFLYIGLGDGGSGGDPENRAQNPAELLGKMLRIDVNVPDGDPIGYRVPPTNPFVSGGPAGTLPEIWGFGLRNPWRYNFDDPARRGTGALVIGDVGQSAWEEVDYEPPGRGGRNYGWSRFEGSNSYNPSIVPATSPVVDPIHQYDHGTGDSITGGYVYRGCGLGPSYQGRYFFADFVQGRVWSIGLVINPSTGEAQKTNLIEHTTALGGRSVLGNVSSFGLDAAGELYVVNYSAGTILKLLGAGTAARPGDFDCDGRSDVTVYRPSNGTWYVVQSGTNNSAHADYQWGISTDIPVPADYDGDGETDLAVFRPATGSWYVLLSGTNFSTFVSFQWGVSSDKPVPGDYDGDGKTDVAVYRPATGVWYVLRSTSNSTTFVSYQWGVSTDVPVASDYDGDGKTDVAVYRATTGSWYVLLSTTNSMMFTSYQWGVSTDVPVPSDYDGDGKTDVAVYRPGTGVWYILQSTTNSTNYVSYQWGVSTDIPVPGDYDGDGKTDVAMYRPTAGAWYVLLSTTNSATFVSYQWGVGADFPVIEHK